MLLTSYIVRFGIPSLKCPKFLPSSVYRPLMGVFGIAVEVGATLYTEPTTVLAAQGLEGQIEHHVVTEQGFQVQELAVKAAGFIFGDLAARIGVKLLDVDLLFASDLAQATYALPAELDYRGPGHQHPLDHRFQPKVKLNR
jgi:hypothetical protein